jgi:hypothetical protein
MEVFLDSRRVGDSCTHTYKSKRTRTHTVYGYDCLQSNLGCSATHRSSTVREVADIGGMGKGRRGLTVNNSEKKAKSLHTYSSSK